VQASKQSSQIAGMKQMSKLRCTAGLAKELLGLESRKIVFRIVGEDVAMPDSGWECFEPVPQRQKIKTNAMAGINCIFRPPSKNRLSSSSTPAPVLCPLCSGPYSPADRLPSTRRKYSPALP